MKSIVILGTIKSRVWSMCCLVLLLGASGATDVIMVNLPNKNADSDQACAKMVCFSSACFISNGCSAEILVLAYASNVGAQWVQVKPLSGITTVYNERQRPLIMGEFSRATNQFKSTANCIVAGNGWVKRSSSTQMFQGIYDTCATPSDVIFWCLDKNPKKKEELRAQILKTQGFSFSGNVNTLPMFYGLCPESKRLVLAK